MTKTVQWRDMVLSPLRTCFTPFPILHYPIPKSMNTCNCCCPHLCMSRLSRHGQFSLCIGLNPLAYIHPILPHTKAQEQILVTNSGHKFILQNWLNGCRQLLWTQSYTPGIHDALFLNTKQRDHRHCCCSYMHTTALFDESYERDRHDRLHAPLR